jgi:hypothetical protein
MTMSLHAEPLQKSSTAPPTPARAAATAALADSPTVQRLQATSRALNARPDVVAQRALGETLSAASTTQRAPVNRTGLPDTLKAGVETLSGMSMDDVRVHRNSGKPSQLQAHAYARGTDIHVAPGQERHLPHEAWHVVQQKQGRVQPTTQLGSGVPINDDAELEHEADVMGSRAVAQARLAAVPQRTPAAPEAVTDARVRRSAAPGGAVAFQLGKTSTGKRRKAAKEKKKALELDRLVRDVRTEDTPEATPAFHQFGDEFRNVEVDPDATGDGGIFQSGDRPEDAPIVDRFRQAYNRLDSWAIYLGEKHPDILEVANQKFDLDRRYRTTARVKTLTKEYKEKFRNLDNTDIYLDQAEFESTLEEEAGELEGVTKKVSQWVRAKHPELGLDTGIVHEEGTRIWREKWTKAVATVNAILQTLWEPARKELDTWIAKQPRIKQKHKVGNLTYIGSLAKGYKGPPKQHVRFNPSDFDIDANLDAPSLAEYAMRVDKLLPDRNRIFARRTTITPLIRFADRVQQEMVARIDGIEENPDDLFDVVIVARDTLDQQEEADEFLQGISARDRRIMA